MIEHVFAQFLHRRKPCVIAGILYLHASNGVCAEYSFAKGDLIAYSAYESCRESIAGAGGIHHGIRSESGSDSALDMALVVRALFSQLDNNFFRTQG